MKTLKILRKGREVKLWYEYEEGEAAQYSDYLFTGVDKVALEPNSDELLDEDYPVRSEVEPEPSGEPKGEDALIAQWQQIAQEQKVLIDQLLDTIAKISNAPMVVPVDRRY